MIELVLPGSAPMAKLLVEPTDRVKDVARQVARLCSYETSPLERWSLALLPIGYGDEAHERTALSEVALDREDTVEQALGGRSSVCVVAVPSP